MAKISRKGKRMAKISRGRLLDDKKRGKADLGRQNLGVSALSRELYRRDACNVVDARFAERKRQPPQFPFLRSSRSLVLRKRIERSPCVWLLYLPRRPDEHSTHSAIR